MTKNLNRAIATGNESELQKTAYQMAGTELLENRFEPACYAKALELSEGQTDQLEIHYVKVRAGMLLEDFRRISWKPTRQFQPLEPAPRRPLLPELPLWRRMLNGDGILSHLVIALSFMGIVAGQMALAGGVVDSRTVLEGGFIVLLISILPAALASLVRVWVEKLSYLQVTWPIAIALALCSLFTAYRVIQSNKPLLVQIF